MNDLKKDLRVIAIRKLIIGWMHQCKYLMDRTMITASLRKYEAIEILTQRFNFLKDKSLDVHYEWLVKLRNEVIDILPATTGRYNQLRVKLILLLDEAEKKVNSDAMIRVGIH